MLKTFEKLHNERIKAIGRLRSKHYSIERKMPNKNI